jgi:hypothetical protein
MFDRYSLMTITGLVQMLDSENVAGAVPVICQLLSISTEYIEDNACRDVNPLDGFS